MSCVVLTGAVGRAGQWTVGGGLTGVVRLSL